MEMSIAVSGVKRKLQRVKIKCPNIKFYKNQFSFSSTVICQVTHRLTDIAQTVGQFILSFSRKRADSFDMK